MEGGHNSAAIVHFARCSTNHADEQSAIDTRTILADDSSADRAATLRRFLRAEVAAVLGLSHVDKVAFDRGFFELGMDSLTSVEFRNNIQTKLGYRVPTTVAFDFPTIDALTAHLLDANPAMREMTTAEVAGELERELAASDE